MTPREAARKLNISYESVLYHIKETGLIKAEKNASGRWEVDPDSVAAFRPPEPPGKPGGRYAERGAGRPPNPDTLEPAEHGKRHLYLGPDISLDELHRIRLAFPKASLRASILLRLAELAEIDPENFKRTLEDLGVEL